MVLKGSLYRKLKKIKKQDVEETFPEFSIEKPQRMVELPPAKDLTELDVTYPLIEPFVHAHIKWSEIDKQLRYEVIEPKLNEEEKKLMKKISDGLIELTEVGLSNMKNTSEAMEYLSGLVNKVMRQFDIKLSKDVYVRLMYYIYRNFVGLNEIEPLMQDPNIEDISCDGVGIPIYIIHRKYGAMRTNIVFYDPEELRQLVIKLAERCGRYVSYAEPILDATLPDGSLDYNEFIIFKENGEIKTGKIGELVDKIYPDNSYNVPVKVKNIEVPAFDLENLKVSWRLVDYVYRHKHEGHLYRLTLETNRNITLTGSHSIFVLTKNGIVTKETSKITAGDYVVIPTRLPEAPIEELNLVEKFTKMNFSNNLIISNVPNYVFENSANDILRYLEKNCKNFKQVFKSLKKKHKLPIGLYTLLWKEDPRKVEIEEKHHPSAKLPSILPLSKELMRILGYYVAVGWASAASNEYKICFSFGSREKRLIEDLKFCAKKCFNACVSEELQKNKNEIKAKITSRLVFRLLNYILKISHGAKCKEVPPLIFNVKKDLRREFIKAWWTSCRGTASKKLISDILYLLLMEGKIASFSKSVKKNGIKSRKHVSSGFYTQRLLTKGIMNYPHSIPLSIFNPLKTSMRLSNKRISREEMKRLLNDPVYIRLERLDEKIPKQFYLEWRKKGILEKSPNGYFLSEMGKEVLKEVKIVKKLVDSDLGFVKVKNIEKVEPSSKFVYDVSVSGLENFVGGRGGVFCHNSRVAATVASDVATRGATFTIRKFTEEPFSPVHQMELNTASSEMLAYIWYMVEHKASILVVGGTATGKTSLLNSISMFIHPTAKIVSIEDTKELRLPHEHWISGLARVGFGVPSPTGGKYGEVTLFDLLRESFRQNPDYVLVGETRGEEAYVMFQGMASGHASMSTFHAGSVEGALKRLTSPPINLSPTLIESLDIIIVMSYAREIGKSARRIKEINEVVSVDPKTGEAKINLVYRWDPVKDSFIKVNESFKLGRIASDRGTTLERVNEEISRRARILEWMLRNGIKSYKEVSKFIAEYYIDPLKFLEMIEKPAGKIEEKVSKKSSFASVLEMLGFKVVEERK